MFYEYGKYKILSEVGSGGFGQVYLAVKSGDKKAYILKTLKEEFIGKEYVDSLKKEIEILNELNKAPQCNYIPILYDPIEEQKGYDDNYITKIYNKSQSRPYYVIDFYSKGCLYYYINLSNNGLSEKNAKYIFKKIVQGIQFCHNRNICHLDIKPDNILFDKEYNPIIIDFGAANKYKDKNNKVIIYKTNKCSESYKSPEMFKLNKYTGVESDIFSLGVILFNLVMGTCGFMTSEIKDPYYNLIINNKGDVYYKEYWEQIKQQIKKETSKEFKEL